jgi:hypothetical protein
VADLHNFQVIHALKFERNGSQRTK